MPKESPYDDAVSTDEEAELEKLMRSNDVPEPTKVFSVRETQIIKLRNPDGSLRWKVKVYPDKIKISDNEQNERPHLLRRQSHFFRLVGLAPDLGLGRDPRLFRLFRPGLHHKPAAGGAQPLERPSVHDFEWRFDPETCREAAAASLAADASEDDPARAERDADEERSRRLESDAQAVQAAVIKHIFAGGKAWVQNEFEVDAAGGALVLKSPNGTRYKITVSNTGVLSATQL